ncbi:MAG: MFS transporter [Actinomycetota bacterium]|nr:MFS transporter [Actinomycetota bacterium]
MILRTVADVARAVESAVDLSDPLVAKRARRSMLVVVIIALGGVFVDAYDFTSLGIGVIQLRKQFHLGAAEVGMLSATMAVSALFGAVFGGYLVDKLGRLPMFLLDLYFFVFSALGAALAPDLWALIGFRLMMGLGVGLDFPVALSFVAEFSQRSRRGRFVNLSYINWYSAALVGFATSYLAYSLGAGVNLWRIAVGFGAVPAAAILVLRYKYMLESPLWAARKGNLEAAADVLRRTRGLDVEVIPGPSNPLPPLSLMDTYRILFAKPYRRRSILAAIIGCAQSIEYYAVIFYLPVIAQLLFGRTMLMAILGGGLFTAVGLLGAAFQAMVCDRTGIRPLTLAGAGLAIVALGGIAVGHALGVLALEAATVGAFMLGHTIGPGPQGMAYGTLSFPTAIRASGVGWTQGMLRVGSIVGFLAFPIAMSAFGFTITFLLLMSAPLVILVATLAIKWEPVGVDIEGEGADLLAKLRGEQPDGVLAVVSGSDAASSSPGATETAGASA